MADREYFTKTYFPLSRDTGLGFWQTIISDNFPTPFLPTQRSKFSAIKNGIYLLYYSPWDLSSELVIKKILFVATRLFLRTNLWLQINKNILKDKTMDS